MDGLERDVSDALAMGRRNAELIALARKHCAHLRVEHSPLGGVSMLEQETGLPISMREFHCEHAARAGGAAANLEILAVRFYENNCRGCPKRVPLGVPNLATLADSIIADRQANEQREANRQKELESARVRRRQRRADSVKHETQPTRDLVARINRLDSRDEPLGIGDELVALVKGAPQLVTEAAGDALVEAAATTGSEAVLEAVRWAAESSRITKERALRVASNVLSTRDSVQAARILLAFSDQVTAELLAPARRSLIVMSGESAEPPFASPHRHSDRETVWVPAFELLVAVDLTSLLADLEHMLKSEEQFDRERAGAAAEALVSLKPEVTPVLSRQLVAAIGLTQGRTFYDGKADPSAAIARALTECLMNDPTATEAALEDGAGALTDGQRDRLFDAYDRVVRRRYWEASAPRDIGAVVAEACLRRARGDWGPEAQRAAVDTLELIAERQGHLLDGRIAALFSLLLEIIASRPSTDTGSPDPQIAALESMNARFAHSHLVHQIREAIGGLAPRMPKGVLEHVRAFLSDESLQTDEAKEIRAECVRLLGDVGKSPEFLPHVLPLIYSAMVHVEQLMRAAAIEALETSFTANREATLPFEFSATLFALLTDPYVIVHRAAAHALAFGLPVREEYRRQVIAALIQLGVTYEQSGQDPRVIDDVVDGLLRLSASIPEIATVVSRTAARLASQMLPGDRVRFLTRQARSMIALPEYVATLLEALRDPAIVLDHNMDDDTLRQTLHKVPARLLHPRVSELREAALVNLPYRVGPAVEYVEVLQRLGMWADAVGLAEELVGELPETTEGALVRTLAEDVLAAARVEQAIAEGEDPMDEIQSWAHAESAHERAMREAATEAP